MGLGYSELPPYAVVAGYEPDGDAIYLGRAYYHKELLPAKVIPTKRLICVCYGGQEHRIYDQEIEILCDSSNNYEWIKNKTPKDVPKMALPVGLNTFEEQLYFCRGELPENYHTPGKYRPSLGICYIPYQMKSHEYRKFDVLVQKKPIDATWIKYKM